MTNRIVTIALIFLFPTALFAQHAMTPELLWSLGRVTPETVTPDGQGVVLGITYFDAKSNTSEENLYKVNVNGGIARQITRSRGTEGNVMVLPGNRMGYEYSGQLWMSDWNGSGAHAITNIPGGISNVRISPDANFILYSQDVQIDPTVQTLFPDLKDANAHIITSLGYRHWDTWENGAYSHIFFASTMLSKINQGIDIMAGEPYDCPQQPFGGLEDVIWAPDSKHIVYVTKRASGTDYMLSTNTDIFSYDITTGETKNLTDGMMGYDTNPEYAPDGNTLAWLSMERNGYESDKNRLFIMNVQTGEKTDLTTDYDETIDSYVWSQDGKSIYFISPVDGTMQIFVVDVATAIDPKTRKNAIRQLTNGDFDIKQMVGEVHGDMIVSRTDFNHAAEIFRVDLSDGSVQPVSEVNKNAYDTITLSKVERQYVKTTDGKQMLVWIVYPPDYQPDKKYPTLLYCEGGPQSPLTQFYSFRWNLQLMAANGYIVVAPNRRGMPGHGIAWNEAISKDWGGQAIKDYLSAIDFAKKNITSVDASRCGAVGASYGGYSVYMLAGVHDGRFKTFIAHDGLFNLQSFYGTTDEMWFANWDIGGPYWEKGPQDMSYTKFNPINFVAKWDTPILIFQGGHDYRTTQDQAFQAFQAAQLRGIKSKLVYFPDESHWVSSCQDGLLWQREFFSWLKETL